jgi:tetratricopeptide (TPR) repeat protein
VRSPCPGFQTLRPKHPPKPNQTVLVRPKLVINSASPAWIAGVTGHISEFEGALQSLTKQLPEDDAVMRVRIQAVRGEALSRRGDWEKGFDLLRNAAMSRECTMGTWIDAVYMSLLLNDTAAWRSLCIVGLSRFAAGADEETSRLLFDGLRFRPSDLANHPITKELQARALQGRLYTRDMARRSLAHIQYLDGNLAEAEQSIEASVGDGNNHYQIEARLLRAAIRARLGRIDEAREDYLIGVKRVSPHFQNRNIPFDGYSWGEGCAFELDRREAAAALGNAVPKIPQ